MQHGHDRPSAAGMMRLLLERLHQPISIEALDMADHDRVHPLGGLRVLEVREVAAGHQEDVRPT